MAPFVLLTTKHHDILMFGDEGAFAKAKEGQREKFKYRSGTVNSNTVNSKFYLIRNCCKYLARFLSFHV